MKLVSEVPLEAEDSVDVPAVSVADVPWVCVSVDSVVVVSGEVCVPVDSVEELSDVPVVSVVSGPVFDAVLPYSLEEVVSVPEVTEPVELLSGTVTVLVWVDLTVVVDPVSVPVLDSEQPYGLVQDAPLVLSLLDEVPGSSDDSVVPVVVVIVSVPVFVVSVPMDVVPVPAEVVSVVAVSVSAVEVSWQP